MISEEKCKQSINDNLIRVDYYEGAYGPTILFILKTPEQLDYFYHLIKAVKDEEGCEISLCEDEHFMLFNMDNIILVNKKRLRWEKKLALLKRKNAEVYFNWGQDKEDWDDCSELINALRRNYTSGHQYLTREGTDDALIKVSYDERIVK